jgi:hypothetical protein
MDAPDESNNDQSQQKSFCRGVHLLSTKPMNQLVVSDPGDKVDADVHVNMYILIARTVMNLIDQTAIV